MERSSKTRRVKLSVARHTFLALLCFWRMEGVAQISLDTGGALPASSVSLNSSANPSPVGGPLSLSATVSSESVSQATGHVTFTEDGKVLGIADVVAGTATLPISSSTNEPASLCNGAACLGPNTTIKYVSQLGCAYQDSDLMYGGGHDDTACINAALASATKDHPILLWQDGTSLIGGSGIQGPASGYWGIIGSGAIAMSVHITSCGWAGGPGLGPTAFLGTAPNVFAAGETIQLDDFRQCPLIGVMTRVSAVGLSSTKIQVPVPGNGYADEPLGNATSLSGTGFYFADGSSGDVISNGILPVSGTCEVPNGPIQARGANVLFQDFAINGNHRNNNYPSCFGIDLVNLNNVRIENVMFYNIPYYAVKLANAGNVVISGSKVISTSRGFGGSRDGVHIDGPANDITIYDGFFQTSDDTVAVNAKEGFCGPISRVKWTNSILDENWNAIRLYNGDLDSCPNGLIPLIDSVNLDNVSGSVYEGYVVNFGGWPGGLGTLSPAITSFQYNNSVVTNLLSAPREGPILLTDNVGSISLTNFTFINPNSSGLFSAFLDDGLTGNIGSLNLNNVTIQRTSSSNYIYSLLGQEAPGHIVFGTLNINGFHLVDVGGSYGPMACLLCSSQAQFSAAQANVGNVDPSQVLSITQPGFGPFNIVSSYPFGPPHLFNEYPIGQHTIIATYSGDAVHLAATSEAYVQKVTGSLTTTAIIPSANPSLTSETLVLRCVVTGSVPTRGTVTVTEGTNVVGSALLQGGEGTILLSGLAPGQHLFVASYGGDARNESSTSLSLNQLVLQSTTVSLGASQNPALALSSIILSAQVSSSSGYIPTGTVRFIDGTTLIGNASLDSKGLAALSISSLAHGFHAIYASYSGDLHNPATSSELLNESIQPWATSQTLSWTPLNGQQIEISSSLTASGPVIPTGNVQFLSNGAVLTSATVDNTGSAKVSVTLPSGPITITASYSGDAVYAESLSAQAVVGRPTFTLQLHPDDVTIKSQEQGTVTVSIGSIVNFKDTIQFGCSQLPNAMQCSFDNDHIALSPNASQSVQLVLTTKQVFSSASRVPFGSAQFTSAWLVLFPEGYFLSLYLRRRPRPNGNSLLRRSTVMLALASTLLVLEGCHGLQFTDVVPGDYTVQLSAKGLTSGIIQTCVLHVKID